MENFIKKIIIFIIITFFIVAFSKSYSFLNIDNLAFAVALGIDTSETNNIKVTFQFVNLQPNNQGSSQDAKIIIDTVDSSSIASAINTMNAYLDKKIDLSHCKTIVFSEGIAQQDITNHIYSLMNDVQVRPSSNVIISKCDAEYYIRSSEPSLETSITQYYQTFPKSSKYTGFVSDATIGDFFDAIVCNSCEAHAILGGVKTTNTSNDQTVDKTNSNMISGSSPINGVRRTENLGIAVFKSGTLVGEMNAIETACYHILKNDGTTFLISIPNPEKPDTLIDIYMTSKSKPKINAKIINGSPYIKINCNLSGKLASISKNSKYLDTDILNSISNSCNNYLESKMTEFLYRSSLELKSDFNGFGMYILSSFKTNREFDNYNWENNYINSSFDVNINTSIDSAHFLTQT